MHETFTHNYLPVDGKAAEAIVAEVGAMLNDQPGSSCRFQVCAQIDACHGQCMVIMGKPLDDALDETGENMKVIVILQCDYGARYSIDNNQRPIEVDRSPRAGTMAHGDPIVIPASLVRPAGTLEERARAMRRKTARASGYGQIDPDELSEYD